MDSNKTLDTTRQCDNCKAVLVGPFCAQCGQSDKNYKRSLRQVIGEFIREQLDLQSRASYTFKVLFTRPGFLAKEFESNRRASYITPIRMYLFSSLAFFLLMSSNLSDRLLLTVFRLSLEADSQTSDFRSQYDPVPGELIDNLRANTDDATYALAMERLQIVEDTRDTDTVASRRILIQFLAPLEYTQQVGVLYNWALPILVRVGYKWTNLFKDLQANIPLVMVMLLPLSVSIFSLLHINEKKRLVFHLIFCMYTFVVIFVTGTTMSILRWLSWESSNVLLKFVYFIYPTMTTTYGTWRVYSMLEAFLWWGLGLFALVHCFESHRRFYGTSIIFGSLKFVVAILLLAVFGVFAMIIVLTLTAWDFSI